MTTIRISASLMFAVVVLCQQASTSSAQSANSITAVPYSYSQNFDTLATSGTANTFTNGGTPLGTGWYSNQATYRADAGGNTTGALYSYGTGTSTERALGSIASGTTSPILYGVQFQNNTGAAIDLSTLSIAYTGEQWRNGGNTAAQTLEFGYQISATALTNLTGGIYTIVSGLSFTSPTTGAASTALDGNLATNQTAISGTVTGTLNIGDYIMFRWNDINDAGSDHALAIDNFVFGPAPVPEPATVMAFAAGVLGAGGYVRRRVRRA